jgi:UDP-N-acetyl-2-amino-2-deoxyglucuronate dehydrogenase
MPYGFGIIGCGMIARFHAKAIADLPDAKLIGCFNRSAPAAEKFAAEVGCRHYATLAEMLADPAVHVVVIGTPSGAHLEPALAAANAGKHVIVEKPLEVTLSGCDAIIAACEKNNVKLSTIFQSRFHQASRLLKSAVDQNRFGRLTMGDAYVKWWRTQQYYDSAPWRGTWKYSGGGALINQAIHTVDLLTWFMGPVAEVTAHFSTLAHERISVEDTCVATLRFANGALGVIEASTSVFPGYLKRIELHGSQGSAIMEEEDIKAWDFANKDPRDEEVLRQMAARHSTGGGASDPAAIGHHGHAAQFADVLDAIKTGRTPAIDGHEGRRSVEIILAIYQSAEIGRSVALPLTADPALSSRQRDQIG